MIAWDCLLQTKITVVGNRDQNLHQWFSKKAANQEAALD